MRLCHIFNKR